MKLATLRVDPTPTDGSATSGVKRSTRAVRLDDESSATDLGADTLEEFLAQDGWWDAALRADGVQHLLAEAAYAPLLTRPGKIVCVGRNYASHIREMGDRIPEHPTLFAKFADALIGADDDIWLPPESHQVDWECELAVVMGRRVRRPGTAEAAAAIAGFAVLNDISMRDWQNRTRMWLQGKTWEHSTPFGPWLVTPEELAGGPRPALDVRCTVDGEVMQADNTADMVFDPVALVQYVATIVTLHPGDVIASGTSGGVGHARTPPRYLAPGSHIVTEIAGLGRCENRAVAEPVA